MKFRVIVLFNAVYNNSFTERIIDENDWPIEMGILKAMVMSGEIKSFEVSLYLEESLECTCFNCDPGCEYLSEKEA